ncbi:MAG: hypothetical protein IPK57_15260 [Chitinophagaceae bacterium]|nr:hypothetical protein [Chitinophagaceae bacterium]
MLPQKLNLSKDGDTITITGDYFKNAATYGTPNFFRDQLASLRYYEPFLKRILKIIATIPLPVQLFRLMILPPLKDQRKGGNPSTNKL